MNPRFPKTIIADLLALALGTGLASGEGLPATTPMSPIVTVTRRDHHGWTNAFVLANGQVEAVIVPQIGRVMQFRFVGTTGPFWENPARFGLLPNPRSEDWGNFGGDKSWPAPQADWPKVTPRAWPPPVAFDSLPVEATVDGSAVVLASPVDPHYGIRTHRRIELLPDQPAMRIATRYTKVSGAPVNVAVWVITQLRDPAAVFLPVPPNSRFAKGYLSQSAGSPLDLQVAAGLISLRRGPQQAAKIGNDAGRLLWVGHEEMLLIECPRGDEADYPDGGASAEVYTNPDPLPYVELETLGPLATMKAGDHLARTNTYRLFKRGNASLAAEVGRLLSADR